MKDLSGPSVKIGLFIKPGKIIAVRSDSNKITACRSEEFDSILYTDQQLFASKINDILKQLVSPKESVQIWHAISEKAPHNLRFSIPDVTAKQQPSTALWHFQQNCSMDLSKFLFDYEVHEKTVMNDKNMQVISGMIFPRSAEIELQNIFKHTDFKLFGLTTYWQAWYNLFKKQNLQSKSKCVAFLCTGLHSSAFQVFKNGEEIISRHIKIGLSRFYDIHAKHSVGDTTDSEFDRSMTNISLKDEQRINDGSSFANEAKLVLNSFWQKLEITLDILAKQKGEFIDTIYICGRLPEYNFFKTFVTNNLPQGTELKILTLPEKTFSSKADFPDDPDNETLDAAVLSLCDDSNTKNFLFPSIEKIVFQNFLKKVKITKIGLILLSVSIMSYWFIYFSHITTLENNIKSNKISLRNLLTTLQQTALPTRKTIKVTTDQLTLSCNKVIIVDIFDKIIKAASNNVKLTKLQLTYDDLTTKKTKAILSGVITGDEDSLDFHLGSLIKDLDLEKEPTSSSAIKTWDNKKVLSFNIKADFNGDINAEETKK